MVGDSAPADVAGGRGVGLCTAWLRCGRSWDDSSAAATIDVDSFAEAARRISPPR